MANELTTVRRLIADDAHALTFQTFGQYRTALLKAIDALPPVAGEAVAGAIDARGQEVIDRATWAKLAAKAHGWSDDSTPPMVDGRFETGWHESEFQTFMQGVRHGRS